MIKCPICNKGTLKPTTEKHVLFGVDLGTYPGERCSSCGEIFTDSSVMEKIESVAKQNGIWGLGKKIKIARLGNSLASKSGFGISKGLASFTKESKFVGQLEKRQYKKKLFA